MEWVSVLGEGRQGVGETITGLSGSPQYSEVSVCLGVNLLP